MLNTAKYPPTKIWCCGGKLYIYITEVHSSILSRITVVLTVDAHGFPQTSRPTVAQYRLKIKHFIPYLV
jgi:hypothetical protein